MEMYCENCLDNDNSIFRILSEKEREILKENYQCKPIKKGEVIFSEGDAPTGLICLSKGTVKVFINGVGGREQIFRMAKPVGFIGYRALFANEKYNATAVALEDSVICVFNRKSLFKVIRLNPDLAIEILQAFASELGFTFNRTVTLTQKHIRGRLAESLVFLKDTYGFEEDNQTIKVYLSREDLANLSNMTTSNAIRTLSAFAHEKIVELKGRKIKIRDLDQLEKISAQG